MIQVGNCLVRPVYFCSHLSIIFSNSSVEIVFPFCSSCSPSITCAVRLILYIISSSELLSGRFFMISILVCLSDCISQNYIKTAYSSAQSNIQGSIKFYWRGFYPCQGLKPWQGYSGYSIKFSG